MHFRLDRRRVSGQPADAPDERGDITVILHRVVKAECLRDVER